MVVDVAQPDRTADGRSFGTIDNSDPVSHTFKGFGGYLVVDARANFRIDKHWNAALGVENLGNDRY